MSTAPAARPGVDEWLDPEFGNQLDTREHPQHHAAIEHIEEAEIDPSIPVEPEDDDPENLSTEELATLIQQSNDWRKQNPNYKGKTPAQLTQPEPEPEAAPVAAPEQDIEVIDIEGGGQAIIDRTTPGKFLVTLDQQDGSGRQVFHVKDEREIARKLAIAQVNASKKIRQFNREKQLAVQVAPQPEPQPEPSARQLTQDESFALKAKIAADPAAAFDEYFQKRTGMTPDQMTAKLTAAEQRAAYLEQVEAVKSASIEFATQERPQYYDTPNNRDAIARWLVNNKCEAIPAQDDTDYLMNFVCEQGVWTTENLVEAYDDLNASGLLEQKPRRQAPSRPVVVPQPQNPQPATPPAQDSRIANVVRRPRASLGIRSSTAVSVPTVSEPELSVEALENLSDEEIQKLYLASMQYKRQGSRR